MNTQDFSTGFLVDKSAKDAFEAITNVRLWWTENLEGNSYKLGDEFIVRFGEVHYSKQKLVEIIPDSKVVWLVTDSKLSFVKDEAEWTGTKVIFEVYEEENETEIRFTHAGLSQEKECYDACSNAWSQYIQQSLRSLITVKGYPEVYASSIVI